MSPDLVGAPARLRRGLVARIGLHLLAIAASAMIVTSPGGISVLTAASVVTLVILVLTRQRRLLLAITACVVVLGSAVEPTISQAAFYARFMMYAALTIVGLIEARNRGPLVQWSVAHPMVALGLLAVGSAFWSSTPVLTIQRGLGLVLLFAALITTALHWVDSSDVQKDLELLVLVAVSTLAIGLVGRLLGAEWAVDVAPSTGYVRFRGFLENPNTVGLLVAIVMPLLLSSLFSRDPARRGVWVIGLLVAIASLLLSESRGGVVATAMGVAVWLFRLPNLARFRFLLAMSSLIVAFVSVLVIIPGLQPAPLRAVVGRFENAAPQSAGGSGRLEAWSLAIDTWRERPFAGWGFGSVEDVFGPRALAIEQVFQGSSPHNAYFNTLLELGPGGLGFLVLGVLTCLYSVRKSTRSWLSAGVAGGVSAGVTISLFESGLTAAGSILAFCFWFISLAAARLAFAPGR